MESKFALPTYREEGEREGNGGAKEQRRRRGGGRRGRNEEKREAKEGEGVKEERRGREMREKSKSWESANTVTQSGFLVASNRN